MATELSLLALRDTLPPSIADDDQLTAIANGLDPESQTIVADTAKYLPYLYNLDNLPSRIVDLLAWAYHVDYYDASATLVARRTRVRQAVAEHKLHGTRSAVEGAFDAVFGAGNYTLTEWFDDVPVRDRHTFRVAIHVPFTWADITEALGRLSVVKSIRSHWIGTIIWDELDALGYTWDALDALALTWDEMDHFYFYVSV